MKKAFLMLTVFGLISIIGCGDGSTPQAATETDNSQSQASGNNTNAGSGSTTPAKTSITGSYYINYTEDTCFGPKYNGDDDQLFVDEKDGKIVKLNAFETDISSANFENDVLSFSFSDDAKKNTIDCSLSFKDNKAKGVCKTNDTNSCISSYIKCNDDPLTMSKDCLCASCKLSSNSDDCISKCDSAKEMIIKLIE